MNELLLSSLPLECEYSRSAWSSLSSAAPSASTFARNRAISAARNAASVALSFARHAPDTRAATTINAACSVVRRVFMKLWLVGPGRGCYDATRSPIDQTLSERPSLRAPKAQVSARKRSGKRTAVSEGGLWRAMATLVEEWHPPKGCGRR